MNCTKGVVHRGRALAPAALMIVVLAGCQGPGPAPQRTSRPLADPLFQTRPPPTLPSVTTLPLEPVAPPPRPGKRLDGRVIVVDPGHGGKDPGAQALSRLPEKTIVLNIALRVTRMLEERGARVFMTRSTDEFVELDQRAALADRVRADLLVSIHADSAQRASAAGTKVFTARTAAPASRTAAARIAGAFERAGLTSRGVDRAGFRVLVGHSRPAVLIECGFLSNRAEAQLLSTTAHQERLAVAIVEGVVDALGR
jgi:N-acetylmuramoyl-L-alanine amidase